MRKLIVIDPLVGRQVIEVDESGAYFDPERVLWDERSDGAMPDIDITGAVRIDDYLIFNEEVAQVDARLKVIHTSAENNARIIAELQNIDRKSIRAMRENDQVRVTAWNEQAEALRAQLVK